MKLEALAKLLDTTFTGDRTLDVFGIKSAKEARAQYLSLGYEVPQEKRKTLLKEAIWVLDEPCDELPNVLVYDSFKKALRVLTTCFKAKQAPRSYCSDFADIDDTVRFGDEVFIDSFSKIGHLSHIGDQTHISSHVSIGKACKIGASCLIYPGVVIYDGCEIGNRVILHSGAVIGADGFGYSKEGKIWEKIEHLGTVVIEDDVEIGANTCIDRATLGETRIGKGTKIDNLVQVGHNVCLGEHCICVSQSGFSGSVNVGNCVIMGGQAAVSDHINIGDDAVIFSRSGVTKEVPSGKIVSGFPAQDRKRDLEDQAVLKQLIKEKKKRRQQ